MLSDEGKKLLFNARRGFEPKQVELDRCRGRVQAAVAATVSGTVLGAAKGVAASEMTAVGAGASAGAKLVLVKSFVAKALVVGVVGAGVSVGTIKGMKKWSGKTTVGTYEPAESIPVEVATPILQEESKTEFEDAKKQNEGTKEIHQVPPRSSRKKSSPSKRNAQFLLKKEIQLVKEMRSAQMQQRWNEVLRLAKEHRKGGFTQFSTEVNLFRERAECEKKRTDEYSLPCK